MEKVLTASESLAAKFRASRDHATIKANRELLRGRRPNEAHATLAMVQALSQTNHALCDHKGSREYTDRSGTPCTDCPHCGGD
jgi:hypothetical protein